MGSCSKDFPLRSSIKAAFGKRSNLVIQARSYLPSKKLSTPIDIQSTFPYPTHLRVTAKECLLTRAKVVPALTSVPLAHPVFKWDAKGNVNPKWNSSVMDGNRVPTTEGQAASDWPTRPCPTNQRPRNSSRPWPLDAAISWHPSRTTPLTCNQKAALPRTLNTTPTLPRA